MKGRIIGVEMQMSQYNLLFEMQLYERVVKITDNLSRTLQKQFQSALESQALSKLTVKTLENRLGL